ncbi:MAG: DUF1080 domain-containing protein [Phycisphaerales bacterium]
MRYPAFIGRAIALGAALILLCGCGGGAPAAEQGFTPLFDGESLRGWRGFVANAPVEARLTAAEFASGLIEANAKRDKHWYAEDGSLKYDGRAPGANLVTLEKFEDFDLRLRWRVDPGGDTGVYLRGYPEVELWDRSSAGSGGLNANTGPGATPRVNADAPADRWNDLRVVMVGDTVSVWMNGTNVVDAAPLENGYEPGAPIPPRGPIILEATDSPAYFRDIRIRRLNGENGDASDPGE